MKIKPKYSIGQEVWFFYYGKIFKDIITHRMTIAVGNRRDDVEIYRTRNFNNLAEYELSPTKEELLKSLQSMKPTKLQKKICELIKSQASFWMNTNDIYSPTHYNDIEESLDDMDELSEEEKEELLFALRNLYNLVKVYL